MGDRPCAIVLAQRDLVRAARERQRGGGRARAAARRACMKAAAKVGAANARLRLPLLLALPLALGALLRLAQQQKQPRLLELRARWGAPPPRPHADHPHAGTERPGTGPAT